MFSYIKQLDTVLVILFSVILRINLLFNVAPVSTIIVEQNYLLSSVLPE